MLNKLYMDGDPRMEQYPFMKTPNFLFASLLVYFLTVKIIGPLWMENKRPYDLRKLMIAYNIAISLANSWIFWNILTAWLTKYSWRCEPVDYSNNEHALHIVFVMWVYFACKLVELLDTIIFVLRKKDNQVSKLHVFHHLVAPITVWIASKFTPGGYATLFPLLNSLVHVFMYLYYGLAAIGPQMQKYLWWKKYITLLQLTQFTIALAYLLPLYFFPPAECKVFPLTIHFQLFCAVVFLILFSQFFMTTYTPKKKA